VIGESTTATSERHVFLWQDGVMTDLGTPVPGQAAQARAVNNAGDVIAYAGPPYSVGSFLSSRGVATTIDTLGGSSTLAAALNDRAQVVGGSQTAGGDFHAFQWRKGAMTDLGTLGGTFSFAMAENDSGAVAGYSGAADGHTHGFVWSGDALVDLGTPGNDSFADAINARGDVAGQSGNDATLWVRS
jgi:probable HAF family extracellular repeat protein